MDNLQQTVSDYMTLLSDPSLPADEATRDLRHMTFWQVYCAAVTTAVAHGQTPALAKGTYADINKKAQIDYSHYSDEELYTMLERALRQFTRSLKSIDPAVVVPYKKHVRGYVPHDYAEMMAGHYRMHIRYLKKTRGSSGRA